MSSITPAVGVSAMSAYLPRFRVQLRDWCEWTGNSWDKVQAVVGHSFRICGAHENVYTMAANAVLRLIRQNQCDPQQVGYLGFGTESSLDNSAGAVIIRGMVDQALDRLGTARLSRHLETPEFKHACLGGVYALKGALRYAALDGSQRAAIVVASDVVKYERGSSGEQTQGAGAVAMLIEPNPRLFEVDLRNAGSASDYRGPDFRKPLNRPGGDLNGDRSRRVSDFPVSAASTPPSHTSMKPHSQSKRCCDGWAFPQAAITKACAAFSSTGPITKCRFRRWPSSMCGGWRTAITTTTSYAIYAAKPASPTTM